MRHGHFLTLATHHHEVADALATNGGQTPLFNHFDFTIDEDKRIVYDYKLMTGREQSYAIQVARTMGLPASIVDEAEKL